MGIGDWGLGIGDWGLGVGRKTQAPTPHPPHPTPQLNYIKLINI